MTMQLILRAIANLLARHAATDQAMLVGTAREMRRYFRRHGSKFCLAFFKMPSILTTQNSHNGHRGRWPFQTISFENMPVLDCTVQQLDLPNRMS